MFHSKITEFDRKIMLFEGSPSELWGEHREDFPCKEQPPTAGFVRDLITNLAVKLLVAPSQAKSLCHE